MTALPQGIRADEMDAYEHELAFYKKIGSSEPERAARGWVIRMRDGGAGRTDRMDAPNRHEGARTDELRQLLEVAVLARHTDKPGPYSGGEAAAALRKEFEHDLARSNRVALVARAESVLEMHGWRRDDGAPGGYAPPSGTYSHATDGSNKMLRWPDAHPSEADARKKLRASGVDDRKMDTSAVHSAITALLAGANDNATDRKDAADARPAPLFGVGLGQYVLGRR